jgi:hypothetical protein
VVEVGAKGKRRRAVNALPEEAIECCPDLAFLERRYVIIIRRNIQQPLSSHAHHSSYVILCRKHKPIIDYPLALLAEQRARMQEHDLVVLGGRIGFAVGFLLRDLHEGARDEGAADIFVVTFCLRMG